MSEKPLSERMQATVDHLRAVFPETYRQCDHLDMIVGELTTLEGQLGQVSQTYSVLLDDMRRENAAMREALRRVCWHAYEGANHLTCELCDVQMLDGATQEELDRAHLPGCKAAGG